MIVYLRRASVVARDMLGSVADCAVLRGERYDATKPDPVVEPRILDVKERRRTSATVRLALEAADLCVRESGYSAADLPAVFGSAFSDGPLLGALLETLATPGAKVSPTKFHNSVHNAALGYWSIAAGSAEGSTSIAASEHTAGATLLRGAVECATDRHAVLVVVYDSPFETPLAAVRPVEGPFAAALLLQPHPQGALCKLEIELTGESSQPDAPANLTLRGLWASNPAAGVIPLLEVIAASPERTIHLRHGGAGLLRVTITRAAGTN